MQVVESSDAAGASDASNAGASSASGSCAALGSETDMAAVRRFLSEIGMPDWATADTWSEMTMYIRGRLNQ